MTFIELTLADPPNQKAYIKIDTIVSVEPVLVDKRYHQRIKQKYITRVNTCDGVSATGWIVVEGSAEIMEILSARVLRKEVNKYE